VELSQDEPIRPCFFRKIDFRDEDENERRWKMKTSSKNETKSAEGSLNSTQSALNHRSLPERQMSN
jgi:hypothetical protein